jgi:manganese/iron transport system permease protein
VLLVSRRSSYTADLTSFLFGRLLTVTPRRIAETAVLAVVVLVALLIGARRARRRRRGQRRARSGHR